MSWGLGFRVWGSVQGFALVAATFLYNDMPPNPIILTPLQPE